MEKDFLHALWAVLGVVVVAELLRQHWRGNRCRALAEQNKAETRSRSHDHSVAERALERIRELANGEAVARGTAVAIKIAVAAVGMLWAYGVWIFWKGT